VANSNTGHDLGAAGDEYGFRDDAAGEDFAWRAVHLTANAAKHVAGAFYGRPHAFAYHVGCSTGGRQGMVAAQVTPGDFDGIVAGAPAYRQIARMSHRLATTRLLLADGGRRNLAFDADGDGSREDLAKVKVLQQRVLERCDAGDGIVDGIVGVDCDFVPARDLADLACAGDEDAANCFTQAQISAIAGLYDGTRNSRGELIYPGAPLGSEASWPAIILPHAGNGMRPYFLTSAAPVVAYTFLRDDPGLLPVDWAAIERVPDADAAIPEWGWWTLDVDTVPAAPAYATRMPQHAGAASARRPRDDGAAASSTRSPPAVASAVAALDATDADLRRYLLERKGKLLLYQGTADAIIPPQPVIDYHQAVIDTTFMGDAAVASQYMRLFIAPGVGHCAGGAGPDRADWLAAVVAWVEHSRPPAQIIATHQTDGVVDNERPLCPYPQRAVFAAADRDANDRANWRAANFRCATP